WLSFASLNILLIFIAYNNINEIFIYEYAMGLKPQIVKQGFFKTTSGQPALTPAVPKAELFDVGGTGDCGFLALAASYLDSFISKKRMKGDVHSKVLTRHLSLFPNHKPAAIGLLTTSERMHALIQHVPMPELAKSVAYT